MNRTSSRILTTLSRQLTSLIIENYQISELEAYRLFVNSETYQLLIDKDLGGWHFSPLALFDIWENEYLTGDLTNSLYVRGAEL